ncbi:hypothetical protein CPC08DRAFT_823237 [Agrocybe pediades]|nr:hypothetical protein CPC08DRAFT_823237 [Agrocybe pediades]
MISGKQVFVAGGQFIQHNQSSVGNKAPIDILTEAVATNALHDSGATFEKPKCHPRTRVKIREIVMRWIELGRDKDDQTGKQFMWLNGAAGCGKSAIAQSTVESCIEHGLPLASFFFSKSDSTRNHAGSLIATLAYQLYCAFPETEVKTEILSAIKKDPLIFKKTIQQQFTSLIIRPLVTHYSKDQTIQQCVPFLIIIDGLDECTDRSAQKAILTGLAESLRTSNLCIPIFVASRPEHEIKLSFGSKYLKDMYTALSLDLRDDRDDADSDIRLYLFDRFAEIKDDFDNRTTGRKLVQDWPGDEVIETLVEKSSHQFIYAATVIRYVESTRHRPDHRLEVVLNVRPVNGEHPFAQLDSLYAMILESVLDIEKVLHVLSLYLMDCPQHHSIRFSIIEKRLLYDEGEVERLFCDMGALVQIYEDGEDEGDEEYPYDPNDPDLYLYFLHASFREYLVDAARSKQFHINMDCEMIRLVTHVLQYSASCCSSSFDPEPMYILAEMRPHWQLAKCISQIAISLELRQAVLSFPLKEFLEPHITCVNREYWELLEEFVTPFLEILAAMVINKPTLTYIQDHQLGILRSVLMQQIQQYFNNDKLALVLILFHHLGSHHFVPILVNPHVPEFCYSTPVRLVLPDLHGGDILSLYHIWDCDSTHGLSTGNVYHCFVRQLLHDTLAGPTAECALGPTMHARAALHCFQELARMGPPLPSSSVKNIDVALITDDAEDDTHSQLFFCPVTDNAEHNIDTNLVFDSLNGGQWQFKTGYSGRVDKEEDYFLRVGYLIFLLPRCGRSDALVAACQDYTRLPDDPFQSDDPVPSEKSFLQYNRFPVRRRRLHEEINKYLARVSPNIMSESRI